jgi:hypothetical protein
VKSRPLIAAAVILTFASVSQVLASPDKHTMESKTRDPRHVAFLMYNPLSSDSPLKLESCTMTLDHLIQSAEVRNVSNKVIRSYTLAWCVVDSVPTPQGSRPGSHEFLAGEGDAIRVDVKPGKEVVAPAQRLTLEDLNARLSSKGAPEDIYVLIGVSDVKFAGGSHWSANPHGFNPDSTASTTPK